MESVPLLWRTVTASPVGIEPMTILEGGGPYNWYLIHNVENSTSIKTRPIRGTWKNSAGRAPRLYETGGSSSTYGAPTITPVKTIAANKSRGISGLVSYLSDSIAWLHDSIWDFRTRKVSLGCKRRIALCILSSVFKHHLNPDHVCTCNWGANGVRWHKLAPWTSCYSSYGGNHSGMAQHDISWSAVQSYAALQNRWRKYVTIRIHQLEWHI